MYQSTVRKTLLSLIFIVITVIILLPYILKNLGLHPDYEGNTFDLSGKKALIIATSHGVLNYPGESSCLLYTSPSPRDVSLSRMPSSA